MLETPLDAYPFLAGGGEAARLITAYDWSRTPLGPIEGWPASMRTALGMILRSPVPIVTLWGEDGIMIYNDGYSVFAGGRHPALFGAKVREGWPEVADFNDHVMKVGLAGGTLAYSDQEFTLFRNGVPEQVWVNLDYSPIPDDHGQPAGVMAIVVETTGKVRAEQDLQAERESLHRMFDEAPSFIALVNGPNHRVTMVNKSFYSLVGQRQLLGRPVREALPEVEPQGFIELLDQVYRTGEAYVGQGMRLDVGTGDTAETRYVDFIYQPIQAADGTISGVFAQGHDVTDQMRVELALRESEERFRRVAEDAPVMLWMSDAQGNCLFKNRMLRSFLGLTSHSDMSLDARILPEDLTAFRQMQADGGSIEVRMRDSRGNIRIMTMTAERRTAADGAFLGLIGAMADATEAREAEEAIRRETRKLAVLNSSGAAIAAELDADRIVQIATDACTELLGAEFGGFFFNERNPDRYRLAALSGALRDHFAHFPEPRITPLFEPTWNGAGAVRSDDVFADPRVDQGSRMPKGHLPVRSYLAVPVRSRNGMVLGGLLFGHREPGRFLPEHEEMLTGIAGQTATALDNARLLEAAERELAERRRAEAALQSLNATLEQRVLDEVYERSKAEDQLRQVQKMEAVGALTGGIAHDFNNMLAVVISGINLLRRRLAKGETDVDRYAEAALDGARRAAALTQRLLAFSRQQSLAPEVIDPNALIDGMTELLTRTLGEAIHVQTVLGDAIWTLRADPGQLENAILNLAVNARDAMPSGGTLRVETSNVAVAGPLSRELALQPGDYVRVAVTDTGLGMSEEVMARAFEPFYTTKEVGKGTGLGLSQVYGFVQQSGGTVRLKSSVGGGTTVAIYLPRQSGEPQAQPEPVELGPQHRARPGETVLVVEDEERVRVLSVEALRELGYEVIEAAHPADALHLLSQRTVSLLFTDLVMPGMSGRELADLARRKHPGLRILYTTGYARDGLPEGTTTPYLLPKPYSLEDLAAKVRAALDRI